LKTKIYGKTHVETLTTLTNLVLLLREQIKFSEIEELSGWFSGEAVMVQEKDNPRLRNVMWTLRRFSIRPPGDEASESSDSGYSDYENDDELAPIAEEKEFIEESRREESHSHVFSVA
jgi:hypothetical protein